MTGIRALLAALLGLAGAFGAQAQETVDPGEIGAGCRAVQYDGVEPGGAAQDRFLVLSDCGTTMKLDLVQGSFPFAGEAPRGVSVLDGRDVPKQEGVEANLAAGSCARGGDPLPGVYLVRWSETAQGRIAAGRGLLEIVEVGPDGKGFHQVELDGISCFRDEP